jgi:hypothetical protein
MEPGFNGRALDDDEEEVDFWPVKQYGKNEIGSGGVRVLSGEDEAMTDEAMTDENDPGSRGPGFSEGRSRVNVKCPHCGEGNRVRLPKHLTVVRSAQTAQTDEAQTAEGKILKTRCAQCAETIRFHAPEGHSFVRRTGEAARHFNQRYRYLTGRGGNPVTRGIRSAREAFRRSYFGR